MRRTRSPVPRLAMLLACGLVLLTACGDDADGPVETGAVTTAAVVDDTVAADDGGGLDFGNDTPTVDRTAELVGKWTIEFYSLPEGGSFTNVVGDTPAFIEFAADGTLTFNTGCNGGSGSYATSGTYYVPSSGLDDEPEGQPISITGLAQTEIGCEGFLGEQDVDLPTNFMAATRFRIGDEGNVLLLDEFLLVSTVNSG